MDGAAAAAAEAGTPWVLDPVAIGALAWRRRIATDLLRHRPAVIRGNASEVLSLTGVDGGGKEIEFDGQLDRLRQHRPGARRADRRGGRGQRGDRLCHRWRGGGRNRRRRCDDDAGDRHGLCPVQAGALGTTFTASQGLLLMIPNMYRQRTHCGGDSRGGAHVATHALSIFGDHSDVMAAAPRFRVLFQFGAGSFRFALIAQAATLESRIPFLHFFDGFRTSHEINKIVPLQDEDLRALIDDAFVRRHRERALSPDHPVLRGTAQNPDVFFQAREACNPFYRACPTIVQNVMDRFAALTGRSYHLFDYVGAPDPDRVIVLMGSAAGAVDETVEYLLQTGEKVGILKVRLFRPFDSNAFLSALPKSTRAIAVLDRTKEPGSTGEPLYADILTALCESGQRSAQGFPRIIGGGKGSPQKNLRPRWRSLSLTNSRAPRQGTISRSAFGRRRHSRL